MDFLVRIASLVRKELLAVLRDKKSRMALIIPPILQIAIFGYAATMNVTRVPYAVLDKDGGETAAQYIADLEGTGIFRRQAAASTEKDIDRMIDNREIVVGLTIPPDFSRNIQTGRPASLQLIADGRNTNTAAIALSYGQQIASGGGALETLARIDLSELDSRLADCRIDVACDVTNPLTGPQGASAVFGPQKGATAQMIDRLDSGLRHYARIIARDLDIDVLSLEGGGAAGGMGAALYAFCGAQLRPGIEIVTDALQLAERVADADLVITGEGRIDSQTIHGKVPVGVARVAKRFNVPVIGIAGSLTADVGVVHQHGLDAVFSVLYTICTLDEALANAAANLRMTARNVAAVLQMGGKL